MHRLFCLAVLGLFLVSTACYRARIETDAKPSTVTIDRSFAASWIFGLVPPKITSTASKCPDGVAKVETKLGFVNQLVGVITFGIYTPMYVKVTCAEAPTAQVQPPEADIVVGEHATDREVIQALEDAAEEAARLERAVIVQFQERAP